MMKNLNTYATENSISLSEYMISEGILDWFKKAWNWLISDSRKNVEAHNGKYVPSEKIVHELKTDECNKWKYKFAYVQEIEKMFNELNSTKKGSTFYSAYEFYSNNDDVKTFAIRVKSVKESGLIGFIFYSFKKNKLTIEKICLSPEFTGEKSKTISTEISSQFAKFAEDTFDKVESVENKIFSSNK